MTKRVVLYLIHTNCQLSHACYKFQFDIYCIVVVLKSGYCYQKLYKLQHFVLSLPSCEVYRTSLTIYRTSLTEPHLQFTEPHLQFTEPHLQFTEPYLQNLTYSLQNFTYRISLTVYRTSLTVYRTWPVVYRLFSSFLFGHLISR